jgi:hypothetical protein
MQENTKTDLHLYFSFTHEFLRGFIQHVFHIFCKVIMSNIIFILFINSTLKIKEVHERCKQHIKHNDHTGEI